jgi:hypothetical protein
MLHDNARPHTAAATQDLVATFGWEQSDHPSYSSDLAPSAFHVFLYLKIFPWWPWLWSIEKCLDPAGNRTQVLARRRTD